MWEGGEEMSDLKPCPFCGCEARLFLLWESGWEGKSVVQCMGSDCGAMTGGLHFRAERAIEIWNRRVEE